MQLKKILTIAALFSCLACNNDANQPEENKEPAKVDTVVDDSLISTTPIPLDGCYIMVIKRDTANMRLNVVDSLVTGDLRYHWFEKDQNNGSVKGVIRDSLLIMDYTFRSEGTMSVRQVVFKLAGTSLVEGTGDMNTSGDTVRYKDISQLKYLYETPFIKTPCAR